MYYPREAEMPKNQQVSPQLRNILVITVILATCLTGAFIWFALDLNPAHSAATPDEQSPSTPKSEWQKGVVPALYQYDPQWADYDYAGEKFSESGCGPISLAMAYIALTGDSSVSPTDVADIATKGGFTSAAGTDWLFMIAGAEELGLQSEQFVLSEGLMQEYLAQGLPIICIMGEGDFTTSGHFIVITGVNSDGTYTVRDSNSVERTNQSWSFDTLYSQHLNAWVLWA